MMECRKFEITIISANNLENVRILCRMKVHARISIGGGSGGGASETEKRTPTDRHGETNPAWNFTMRYTISESMLEDYNSMLVVRLYCKRKLGDRYIGEVHTPMKELFDYAKGGVGGGGGGGGTAAVLTLPVQKGCVNSQGALRFSYRFGEKVTIDKLLLAESVASWSLC